MTSYPPGGDNKTMPANKQAKSKKVVTKSSVHQHDHQDVLLRLKKAHGHLAKVIDMIEKQEKCLDISQQLYAVEKAITTAKKKIIHEHIEHCLTDHGHQTSDLSQIKEFKEITKYL